MFIVKYANGKFYTPFGAGVTNQQGSAYRFEYRYQADDVAKILAGAQVIEIKNQR